MLCDVSNLYCGPVLPGSSVNAEKETSRHEVDRDKIKKYILNKIKRRNEMISEKRSTKLQV